MNNKNKKSILFVVPQLSHGGSNKSLESLLPVIDHCSNKVSVVSLGVNEVNAPYYKVFGSYLVQLSIIYRVCMSWTIISKLLNAIQNYLHYDVWSKLYRYEAKKLLKNEEYDYVVGFEESYATKFASFFNVPHKIAWVHCDYNQYRIESGNRDEHGIYNSFEKIICVSKFAASVFIENFPELNDRVSVIYNLLDCSDVRTKSSRPIEDGDIFEETFSIVSVGRMVWLKQYHLIPAFINKILENNPDLNFRWFVIGNGDPSVEENIKNSINNYHIEKYLFLLGPKNNPYPYIAKANLLACTSKTESWSYVINEAKILGTPVVTLRCGSSEEVVEDNITGVISDENQMPNTITTLIENRNNLYTNLKSNLNHIQYDNEYITNQISLLFS